MIPFNLLEPPVHLTFTVVPPWSVILFTKYLQTSVSQRKNLLLFIIFSRHYYIDKFNSHKNKWKLKNHRNHWAEKFFEIYNNDNEINTKKNSSSLLIKIIVDLKKKKKYFFKFLHCNLISNRSWNRNSLWDISNNLIALLRTSWTFNN